MQPCTEFRTHDGRLVTGGELNAALTKVAADYRELAHAIRREDCYAAHVTEEQKDQSRDDGLALADRVEGGYIESLTTWQRVDTVLTGECVALLPR